MHIGSRRDKKIVVSVSGAWGRGGQGVVERRERMTVWGQADGWRGWGEELRARMEELRARFFLFCFFLLT